jgi:hypothetical protein
MTDRKSNGDLQRLSGGVLSSSEKSGSIFKRGLLRWLKTLKLRHVFKMLRLSGRLKTFL